ncbi:MAG TPA: peptidyl-prolyl cis-trans isomerase [Telluria sp.]|jgi:peptidyl-prolyl cis-trans isomerase C
MTLKPSRLLFVLIAIAAAPSFAQNVAVVNGKAIPMSRADALVKQYVAQSQQPETPELREMVKKDLISREVLMQEATRQGFDKTPAVKQQLEVARQSIIVNAMVRDYLSKSPVKDEEIKAEYDRYKTIIGDKDYHVRHILVDTEAEAKAIITKLKGGAKFEELAKTSKDTGSAANGGDLDWHSPSEFPKPFSDAFVALQKGGITETPVQTQNGFHVIKLDDIRPLKPQTLEELKPQIGERLQQAKLAALQEKLRKQAVIK